jgi:hypothetical protein
MDVAKALLVVVITLVVVVGINAAIYIGVTWKKSRNSSPGQMELLRKAAGRVKDPWESENTNLSELSELVKGFRSSTPEAPDPSKGEKSDDA